MIDKLQLPEKRARFVAILGYVWEVFGTCFGGIVEGFWKVLQYCKNKIRIFVRMFGIFYFLRWELWDCGVMFGTIFERSLEDFLKKF